MFPLKAVIRTDGIAMTSSHPSVDLLGVASVALADPVYEEG